MSTFLFSIDYITIFYATNTEKMCNSTVNFTITTASINSTTPSFGQIQIMEICVHSIGFLFRLSTHSCVLWLIVTGTGSGVASEFFILYLSVCETDNCLNNLIVVLTYWFSSLLTLKQFLTELSLVVLCFSV